MAKRLTNSRAARAAAAAKAKADTNPEAEAGAAPARSEAGPEGSSSNPASPATTNPVAGNFSDSPDGDRPAETAGAERGDMPAPATDAFGAVAGLRIAAKRDGFRRAGVAHSKTPVLHPPFFFSAEQILALLHEPMLSVVEFVLPDGEVISRERMLAGREQLLAETEQGVTMHDAKGRELKVGDIVLIPAVISILSATEDYCNVSAKSSYGRRPDGERESFNAINTGVLIRANRDDRADLLAELDELPARSSIG